MQAIGWTHSNTGAGHPELEVPLNPTQELELASELLEVGSQLELEQFLGNPFTSVGNAVGRFLPPDTAQALGGILHRGAEQSLPHIGQALGATGGVGSGGAWGQLASAAGSLLGLELEGLSPQDQEFETARQFVRFAGAAAHHALANGDPLPPELAAHEAVTTAGHRFAPGLAYELPHRGYPDHEWPAGHPSGPAPYQGRSGGLGSRPSASRYAARSYATAGYRNPRMSAVVRPTVRASVISRGRSTPQYGPGVIGSAYRCRQPAWSRSSYGYGSARNRWGEPSYRAGWPGSEPRRWGGESDGTIGDSAGWSHPMPYFGDAPPATSAGAWGRWVYRGMSGGRRRWMWEPYHRGRHNAAQDGWSSEPDQSWDVPDEPPDAGPFPGWPDPSGAPPAPPPPDPAAGAPTAPPDAPPMDPAAVAGAPASPAVGSMNGRSPSTNGTGGPAGPSAPGVAPAGGTQPELGPDPWSRHHHHRQERPMSTYEPYGHDHEYEELHEQNELEAAAGSTTSRSSSSSSATSSTRSSRARSDTCSEGRSRMS